MLKPISFLPFCFETIEIYLMYYSYYSRSSSLYFTFSFYSTSFFCDFNGLSDFDVLTKLKSNFLFPLSLFLNVGATGPTYLYSWSYFSY